MNHPECLHPTANASDDFSGATCCICDGNPCPAVTVAVMAAHRLFDIALYSESREVSFAPPF